MGLIPVRTTIFEDMSGRARAAGAINLGQGFPDSAGPESVRHAAARAILDGPHHYPPMRGIDALRQAVARFYADTQGLRYDWVEEIVVTSGATEALACAMLALLQPDDAAIILEPAYDAYGPLIRRAGAIVQPVRLSPPHWHLTREMLDAVVTGKTRIIVVNDPVNPTGRSFSPDERAAIRDVALAHDLLIVADEVWEEVRAPGNSHISLAADRLISDRIIKIGSAGKIFQVTGWKVGWLLADASIAARLAATHQFITFTTPPALQQAVAEGLDTERDWLDYMRVEIAAGRDLLAGGLVDAGYCVLPSDATWFLNIDLEASGITMSDADFCRWLVDAHGVAAIPVSAFFEGEGGPRSVVRFCHAKERRTIEAALLRLAAARRALG